MKKYEIMYILRANLEQEAIKAEIEYVIEHSKKGYYVWSLVEATPEAIESFNRAARYSEKIIRHIVVVDGE